MHLGHVTADRVIELKSLIDIPSQDHRLMTHQESNVYHFGGIVVPSSVCSMACILPHRLATCSILPCADLFRYVLPVPFSSSLPSHSSPPPPPLLPYLPLPFFSPPFLLPFSPPPLLPSFSSPSIPPLLPSPPLASFPPHRRPNPLIHHKIIDPRP